MGSLGTIYILVDPRNSVVRYVGQTTHKLGTRLSHHVYHAKDGTNTHLYTWIRCLLKLGFRPEIYTLEKDIPVDELTSREQHWFDYLISKGANLVNTGEFVDCPNRGRTFGKMNEIQRHKISESLKGRIKSPEHLRKIGDKKAKTFNVNLVSPEGFIYSDINNMAKFCREYKISRPNMMKLIKGERNICNGWALSSLSA